MRLYFILIPLVFLSCRKGTHCENATVYQAHLCGVDWEVEFKGTRYPVKDLPDNLKRDRNKISIEAYHFYNDPRLCACCGYEYLVVEEALDELI